GGLVRKVEGIVRDVLHEKGFQFADVTHETKELPGGPKLVHLTFKLSEGPKIRIRRVLFTGNQRVSARTLRARLEHHRQRPWWRPWFLGGSSTYQEKQFDEDADRLVQYYRDRGYITANFGVPELQRAGDSDDGKTRWVDLRIPV